MDFVVVSTIAILVYVLYIAKLSKDCEMKNKRPLYKK